MVNCNEFSIVIILEIGQSATKLLEQKKAQRLKSDECNS